MKITDWLFGKTTDEKKPSSDEFDLLTLACSICGRVYRIGDNAVVTTDEDVGSSGTKIVLTDGGLQTRLDLVGYIEATWSKEWQEESKRSGPAKVKAIRNAIEAGQERYWYCDVCNNVKSPFPYPRFTTNPTGATHYTTPSSSPRNETLSRRCQGRYLTHTFLFENEDKKYSSITNQNTYSVIYEPPLPRNDAYVIKAMIALIAEQFFDTVIDTEPKVLTRPSFNLLSFNTANHIYFFLLVKLDSGEVKGFVVWRESK